MKILRKNILGFVIGGIVFGGISYTIASQILATQVSYSNTKSIEGVTNVDGALTELYGLAEECKSVGSGSGVTYYGKNAEVLYLDPTGIETDCSESKYTSDTGTKDGCMRFYVYAEDGEYKYAILDHNTTVSVSSCSGNCFAKAQSQVKQDTANWDPNLQARNISAIEIYKITESTNGLSSWKPTGANITFNDQYNNGQGYGWLFDRTNGCESYGCTTNDNNVRAGYWTSDIYSSSNAWYVAVNGHIDEYNINSNLFGVRPVIQIAK